MSAPHAPLTARELDALFPALSLADNAKLFRSLKDTFAETFDREPPALFMAKMRASEARYLALDWWGR